ncbi:hypothetical protein ACJX0J_025038 [Zea mays]
MDFSPHKKYLMNVYFELTFSFNTFDPMVKIKIPKFTHPNMNSLGIHESGNTFLNETYSAYQPLEGSSNLSKKYLFTFFGWLESGNTFLNETYSAYQPLEGSSNLSNKYLFTFFGWPKWTLNYMDRLGAMEFLSQI